MNFNEYQRLTSKTAVFPKKIAKAYLALGVAGESGEVADKVKKFLRGDTKKPLNKEEMKKEMGDVLWYLAQLSKELGIPFNDVARANITKLMDRKRRKVLKGSGDNR